jgi:3-hydroxyacyl-[acyl-carrier-protein] dehydratase
MVDYTVKATPEVIKKVMDTIPQAHPFRFIDEITELTGERIVGKYRFKENEFFYPGHFPGAPTTPGVILIEAMAQVAVVGLGIYQLILEGKNLNQLTLFTECEIEFSAVVKPGQLVTIYGEKIYNRKGKLKSSARLVLEDGSVAASGSLAGVGVLRE